MSKDVYSRKGLFGTVTHYDRSGKNVGYSHDRLFGGQCHHKKSKSELVLTTKDC